jgi:hypothetical protein
LKIQIRRSCSFKCSRPARNAGADAGQDSKCNGHNGRRHSKPKRSDMIDEQDPGPNDGTGSKTEQCTPSYIPESDGKGHRRQYSRDVELPASG